MKRKTIGIAAAGLIVLLAAVLLILNGGPRVSPGYVLFAPLSSTTTYLIDNEGTVVHEWKSDSVPGNSVYLLENGRLLRTADPGPNGNEIFKAGGAGGRVEEFDWDGRVTWRFNYSSPKYLQHHDIEKMPNGNILMIAWEYKSAGEAIEAGRDPKLLADGRLWPDHLIEVKPAGAAGGEIVWEWHLWDHLVQDFDATKKNYGNVGSHPELVDLNYLGTRDTTGKQDWNHTNSVDYHADLDQILLSIHSFNEIWIIDHSTTMQEAAGHTGGRSGKGGDLLYRWGNPQAYRAGGQADQVFFGQHDAKWIAEGLPGQGHILVYNNGLNREGPGKGYSTVVEIDPPLDGAGRYRLAAGGSYGPAQPVWTYRANPPRSLYSAYISGAQRLANGNTLICSGYNGQFREVTAQGRIVWRYTNPYGQPEAGGGVIKRNATFRAERYAPDYPGLNGKQL